MNIFNVHILARWTVKVIYLTEACNTGFISHDYPAFQLYPFKLFLHPSENHYSYISFAKSTILALLYLFHNLQQRLSW